MKYLILDPARLTHLIKPEDQLKAFNAFLSSMEEMPYQKNTHQLTAEEKKYRDWVLTGFFTNTLDKSVNICVLDFEPRDEQLRLKILKKLETQKVSLENVTTLWSTALFGCICIVSEDEEIAELMEKRHLDHSSLDFPDRNKIEFLHQDHKTIVRVFDLDNDKARDIEIDMSLVKLKEKLQPKAANSAIYGDC